jgi:hypothetical protein
MQTALYCPALCPCNKKSFGGFFYSQAQNRPAAQPPNTCSCSAARGSFPYARRAAPVADSLGNVGRARLMLFFAFSCTIIYTIDIRKAWEEPSAAPRVRFFPIFSYQRYSMMGAGCYHGKRFLPYQLRFRPLVIIRRFVTIEVAFSHL